jgi:hypothetical protein
MKIEARAGALVARRSKAVGMHLRLQLAIRRVQLGRIEPIAAGKNSAK